MHKKSQIKFIYYFIAVFLISFTFLYLAGLTPASIKTESGDSIRTLWDKSKNQIIKGELPDRIVIDKIGVDSVIANPNTTDVATLDDYLLRGAVRYPGSGLIGQGNMFIFGHSTGIKVVHNQAYKTFNGLKDLTSGDIIKVYSASNVYTYKVTSVKLVDQYQALVEFSNTKNMLTLSTCNTFGEKGERYVVEALFVGLL